MDNIQNVIHVFNKYAQSYQDKFMDVDLYADTFDLFCESIIKKNVDILEIACGPGNITRYLLKKRTDLKILGIDVAPKMIELAKANNPTAEFQLMDCRDIGLLEKKYGAIMCGFCLPYLSKEEAIKLIVDASIILKPSGVLYLSTMEDDNNKSAFKKSSSGEDQMYMNYHEADYLTNALKVNNFEIIDLQRKVYPTDDRTKVIDLVILARKQ